MRTERVCDVAKRIIIVTGVPGSGKSTALEGLEDELAGSSIVSIGTELLKRSGADDRDMLRKGDDADQLAARLRSEILRELVESTYDVVVLDTHAIVKTSGGYIQGFTDNDLNVLRGSVVAVVCVHAEPSVIKGRRDSDKGRRRDNDTETEISQQQEASESVSAGMAERLGAMLYRIDTSTATMGEAQALMAEVVKKVLSASAQNDAAAVAEAGRPRQTQEK